jgi:hypothetical protein
LDNRILRGCAHSARRVSAHARLITTTPGAAAVQQQHDQQHREPTNFGVNHGPALISSAIERNLPLPLLYTGQNADASGSETAVTSCKISGRPRENVAADLWRTLVAAARSMRRSYNMLGSLDCAMHLNNRPNHY